MSTTLSPPAEPAEKPVERKPAPWRAAVDQIFPEPQPARMTWRLFWVVCAAVAAAALIGLTRSRGPGALNSVWIEDAHTFLTDAYVHPFWDNLFKPLFGYYQVGPRFLGELAAAVPVRVAAPLLALIAAGITAGYAAIAYVASGRFFSRWWLRLLAAAPVILLPLGRTQADNDVATLHFAGLYALFWVLLWRPATWAGRAAAIAAMVFVTISSILPLVLLPLVFLRVSLVRDWLTRVLGVVFVVGMGFQLSGLLLGRSTRDEVCCRRYEPFWVVEEWVTKAVPRTLFGEKWLGGPGVDGSGNLQPLSIPHPREHLALILLAWLVVFAVVACAVLKITNPHWPLAITAASVGLVIFAVEVTNIGGVHPRYVIAPALLMITAFAALLRPHDSPQRFDSTRPAIALIVLLAVVAVANFRVDNGRTISQPWSETVRDAHSACNSFLSEPGSWFVYYGPEWWRVIIPCDRLR